MSQVQVMSPTPNPKSKINYNHWILYPAQCKISALPHWKNFDVNLKFVKLKNRESYQNQLQTHIERLEQIPWMTEQRLCELVKIANVLRKLYVGVEK